ncbi:hypothetical protein LU276_03955 [Moraxella haemolytica]|uniref:BRO-N domain-containing protein n=1 Tax=Moraxella haemolytica TaxID=2904119 RepID=UPI0025428E0D|nr:BRO family protein [Moraxella sp. ZY171148]WII95977.1 hypothetical protein LU276_03955 [Moraxella sp. ZY171148]
MKALTFQNITLTPVKVDNQIWLTSAELAKALGYSRADNITNIYNRNADEFRSDTTALIDNPKMKNAKIRIFSLRGCHLIAMFARTKVAKEFRQWVLDILDKEVGQPVPVKTTAHDRTPLIQACTRLSVGYMNISDVYKMVGNHFGYDDVVSIPAPLLPEAVAFVYELILTKSKGGMNDRLSISAQHLAWHTQFIYSWYKAIEEPFRALSPRLCGQIHDHIMHAVLNANYIGKHLGYDGMNPDMITHQQWAVGRYY